MFTSLLIFAVIKSRAVLKCCVLIGSRSFFFLISSVFCWWYVCKPLTSINHFADFLIFIDGFQIRNQNLLKKVIFFFNFDRSLDMIGWAVLTFIENKKVKSKKYIYIYKEREHFRHQTGENWHPIVLYTQGLKFKVLQQK